MFAKNSNTSPGVKAAEQRLKLEELNRRTDAALINLQNLLAECRRDREAGITAKQKALTPPKAAAPKVRRTIEDFLAMKRDSAEWNEVNRLAADPQAGLELRQELRDLMATDDMNASWKLSMHFPDAVRAIQHLGPRSASPKAPPPRHASAMTAAQFLALPSAAQANLADQSLRPETGRASRIELKRAYAEASPAEQVAMMGIFKRALTSHSDDVI